MPLLVIGKSVRPRAFRNQHVPIDYTSNCKAWMTSTIFEEHLRKIDQKMSAANRNIAMIVDNCPSHPHIQGLKSVTLIFLPPNTTSKTQPMDCGVIWSLKSHYRQQLMTSMIICHDAGLKFQPNLMTSMHWLITAWNKVTPETIVNCFHSAGFYSIPSSANLSPPSTTTTLQSATLGAANVFERLCQEFSITNLVFNTYQTIDENIVSSETPNDGAIIASLMEKKEQNVARDNDELDEISDEVRTPSAAEALQMLQEIRLCLLKHSSSTDGFIAIDRLNLSLTNMAFKNKRQATLDNFVSQI